MAGKRKVLIIDNSSGPTGALNSIRHISEALAGSFEFKFIFPNKAMAMEMRNKGFTASYLPFIEIQKNLRLLIYLPMLLINTLRLLSIIRKENIDILHINDLYNMTGVLVKILRPKTALVYHVRLLPGSFAKPLYKSWSKLILKYADKVVVVSKAVRAGFPPDLSKIVLIYDAAPKPNTRRNPSKNKPFTFLYLGNFIQGKGQDKALDAFTIAAPELNSARLIFAGGTMGRNKNLKFLNQLRSNAKSLTFSDQIYFEMISGDIKDLYQEADVVLNFSESESFSMTCLESLLAGTPVIATKCGGPEEIIFHEENGLLVENKNIEQMANTMVRIYNDRGLLDSISNKSEQVSQVFSVEKSSKALSMIYNDLLLNK